MRRFGSRDVTARYLANLANSSLFYATNGKVPAECDMGAIDFFASRQALGGWILTNGDTRYGDGTMVCGVAHLGSSLTSRFSCIFSAPLNFSCIGISLPRG